MAALRPLQPALRQRLRSAAHRASAGQPDLSLPPRPDFVSGHSGQVSGRRAVTRAAIQDAALDAAALLRGERARLGAAAAAAPRRQVLALAVEREDVPNLLARARAEVARSHHALTWDAMPAGSSGKFENLNRLLTRHDMAAFDWLLVLDDDVALPRGFVDNFLFLAERFGLRLAQPAHRRRSHAAWAVTRRRRGSVVRETGHVEIGPVFAFHRTTFEVLLPFPELRFGWGLDSHWSAVAREHGWPIGVVDATPIRHGLRLIASGYDQSAAIAEAVAFLEDRPYSSAAESQRTLAVHRRW